MSIARASAMCSSKVFMSSTYRAPPTWQAACCGPGTVEDPSVMTMREQVSEREADRGAVRGDVDDLDPLGVGDVDACGGLNTAGVPGLRGRVVRHEDDARGTGRAEPHRC